MVVVGINNARHNKRVRLKRSGDSRAKPCFETIRDIATSILAPRWRILVCESQTCVSILATTNNLSRIDFLVNPDSPACEPKCEAVPISAQPDRKFIKVMALLGLS